MSDALTKDSPSKNSLVDVRARIQQYQTSPTIQEPDQLVKSWSMHDMRSMTIGDDGDSWVKLSVIDPDLPKTISTLTPPKPPARRQKFLSPKEPMKPPIPVVGKLTPPESKPRLGSTDLNLLPKTKRFYTTKPIPPRPPPPTLKPTYRSSEKTPSPGPQTQKISNTPSHPSPPRQRAPPIIKQPFVDSEASRDRKSSHTSSSFSDSVEEEKKAVEVPPPRTPTGTSTRGSIFGRFTKPAPYIQPNDFEASFDLEESFDMIPDTNTNLADMVEKLKEKDAKLHDANIYEVVQAVAREVPYCASTKDLPPMINGFPTESRERVVHELYTTEYRYVRQLEVVVEVYKPQLSPLLADVSSQIFANVEDILAFNRGFLALLHTRMETWHPTQCIGDIFLGMFTQIHKSMYAIYCSNYDNAEQVVHKSKKRKDIDGQILLCQSDPKITPGLTLPMYLITPVQRIPRYILLLKDIIKFTSEEHPDYQQLKQALEKMGELADYINLQIQETQTRKTLEHLKSKVHGLSDLEHPSRSLVKEGPVYLKNIKKLYQCILFNDMLVFALGDIRQSTVELQLPLEALWVEDLEDRDPQSNIEGAVEIYTPQRPYTIYMRTNSEKKLWLPKIQETIYQYLLANDKCHRSNKLDCITRYATFVYHNQQVYNGWYTDSLRNGKGTMGWPNHSQYIGDWIDDERCGEGEFRYNTGETYNGRWREDKQNGMGELRYYTGDVYKGSWKDGLRHGKGKILYSNGDVFEGVFNIGHIEGRGKLICANNGVEYNGEWKNSLRHGEGTLKTIHGNKYSGEFRHNQMHGQGKMIYYNGDVYEGAWKNGMRQGNGKLTSLLEGTYNGSWDKGLKHGKGVMKYKSKDEYDGFWEFNKRHGKGIMKLSTGEIYTGDFEYDLMNGEGEMEYSKTMRYKGSWKNNLRHGRGTMYYDDGSEYTGEWHMALRHGEGTWTRTDGIVYRGQWEYDQPHKKGEIVIKSDYKYTGDWVNGRKEGRGLETTEFWTYSGGFRSDMKHGHGEERTSLGTIYRGQWERGRKHGTGERKIAYGLTEEQVWKSGQLQNDPLRMTAVELPTIPRADL